MISFTGHGRAAALLLVFATGVTTADSSYGCGLRRIELKGAPKTGTTFLETVIVALLRSACRPEAGCSLSGSAWKKGAPLTIVGKSGCVNVSFTILQKHHPGER